MTAKDLHFSFDSPLAQAPPARPPQDALPGARRSAAKTKKSTRLAPARANRARTRGAGETSARRAWVTACLISLINMAFLVLAALWLTGNTYDIPGFERAVPPVDAARPVSDVGDLQAGLDANRRQLSELSAAVAAQSDMLLAIRARLAEFGEQQPPQARAPESSHAREASVAAADDWQINLGSFTSAEGATRLQAELASMGYSARVSGPGTQGETAYNVWLDGYESREAADRAAHRLMDQTSLTGLWVWNAH